MTFIDQDVPKSGIGRRGSLFPTSGVTMAPSVSVCVCVCVCVCACMCVSAKPQSLKINFKRHL